MKSFVAACSVLFAAASFAQQAYRCEVNGATVYSDKPCVDGRTIAPTQDSSEQRARSQDAVQQMKADNRAVDARIDKRASAEAKARAAERRAAAKADRAAAAEAKKAKAKKDKEAKARKKLLAVKKAPVKKPPKPAPSSKPA